MTTTSRPTDRRRRRRFDVPGAIATVVVLALAAVAVRWVLTPERFPEGDRLSSPVAVGETLLVTLDGAPSQDVELRNVRPRVSSNTSDAVVRVVLCERPVSRGAAISTAAQRCARLLPLDGSRLPADGEAVLALEITPRAPGVVVVDGVEVDYRDGAQWGSETTGLTVEVSSGS